ncbi:ATP synthase subunit delta [Thiosulfatimonas sediminis]|uniref:ATP synthase subunit delta n=1 Tax=Thiosulfatimonas sediminis TaxID=2675054 RepID=A0A6F8PYA3_9GAMM|nr:F0F1 ATP synthase subunit delta [Thiosulfatimonas sediminis]BBP47101.1 ATP synthase subunit delta [Thiosulfatimonas sediminis]
MAELMKIARPYAEAVFALGKEEQSLAAWSEQLANLALITSDSAMQAMLEDPSRSVAEVISVYAAVMGDGLTNQGKQLLTVMADNKRLVALAEVAEQFEALKAADEKRVRAIVVSAFDVTEEQKNKLSAALNAKFDADVEINYEVDASLIGGIKIKVGDWALDGSALAQLNKLGAAIAQ